MEPEDTIKTGIELPRDLFKRVKIRATERDLRMKDAVREAFTKWLSSGEEDARAEENLPRASTGEPVLTCAKGHEQWHEMLEYVLKKGPQHIANLLTGGLEAWHEFAQAKNGEIDLRIAVPGTRHKKRGRSPASSGAKHRG